MKFYDKAVINILSTFIILNLPILREQYSDSAKLLVTWHRPVDVMLESFQNSQPLKYYLILSIFVTLIYTAVYLTGLLISGFYGRLLSQSRPS